MHLLVLTARGAAYEAAPFREGACVLAVRLAAVSAGVTSSELLNPGPSSRRVSRARQVGMYLAHTVAGLPLQKVAHHFGKDRTTVAHACRLIEDRRDDPKFDRELSELEDLFRTLCGEPL